MNNIIDFSLYQKKKDSTHSLPDESPSEELKLAIQTLIEQLRTAPLKRIG